MAKQWIHSAVKETESTRPEIQCMQGLREKTNPKTLLDLALGFWYMVVFFKDRKLKKEEVYFGDK